MDPPNISPNMKRVLLVLNCVMLAIGITAGPLVMRLYYMYGGKSIWLSAWLETGGWPLMILLLLVSFVRRRVGDPAAKLLFMKPSIILSAGAVGMFSCSSNILNCRFCLWHVFQIF